MNNLIKIATVLALAALAIGNLPAVINQVRKAQFQFIQESKASKSPKAMHMHIDNSKHAYYNEKNGGD
jgi:hypothetical protein